jgi:hypothetical protein
MSATLAAGAILKQWGEIMLKSIPSKQALALLADDAYMGQIERKGDTVHFPVDNGDNNIVDVASFSWGDIDAGAFSVPINKNFCFGLKIYDVDAKKLSNGFGTKAIMNRSSQLGAKIEKDCIELIALTAAKPAVTAGLDLQDRILAIHAELRKSGADLENFSIFCDPTVEASILKVMSNIAAADMSDARVNGEIGRFLGARVIASNHVPTGKILGGVPSAVKLGVQLPGSIEEVRLENLFATGYRAQALYGVGTIGKNGQMAADTLVGEAKYWFQVPSTGAQSART